MKGNKARSLVNIPTLDEDGNLQAVIETPKGSRNKFNYNLEHHCLELASALPAGMVFPFDFGFAPSTLADDGDPLDILLLMDAPVPPCCLLQCRLLGVMEARQKKTGGKWERNDRLIAVAVHAQTHDEVKDVSDLPKRFIDDLTEFFHDYNKLHDKKFECLGILGPTKARRLLKKAQKLFEKQDK
ncbi:MAG: inorganic diphosphatase [Pseudomonadota bacterium]|nr:inorganic diphosphatase [Pseudomonadota bacterium]